MNEYAIVDFLKALSEDEIERKILELIAEGNSDEGLIVKLLEALGEKTQ